MKKNKNLLNKISSSRWSTDEDDFHKNYKELYLRHKDSGIR